MAGKLPKSLTDKSIVVVGVGREGTATAEWLVSKGATITLADARTQEDLGETYDRLEKAGVSEWRLGPDYLKDIEDFDVIFRTPMLPTTEPALEVARRTGSTVTTHVALFMELCPAPIIGVSGTKGKGTTSGLIHDMLQAGGKQSFLGGNIGKPPLEFLEEVTKDSVVVLELSSFQLEDLTQSPHVAVLTNLTEDHLDRHQNVEEYRSAKRSLVEHQQADDIAILNADDPGAKAFAEFADGHVQWFSTKEPVSPGAFVDGKVISLEHEGDILEVCKIADIQVPGEHNRANVLAASLAAAAFDVTPDQMKQAIAAYRGLPYHLEFIREQDGIKYFNDSYATNPTAAIPAIQSFEDPLVLILGGAEKNLQFDELATVIAKRNIRGIVLIPPEGDRIAAALKEAGFDGVTKPVTSKEEILPVANELAQSGDVVLLSPAAASFGWFENYQDRGTFFTDSVAAL